MHVKRKLVVDAKMSAEAAEGPAYSVDSLEMVHLQTVAQDAYFAGAAAVAFA